MSRKGARDRAERAQACHGGLLVDRVITEEAPMRPPRRFPRPCNHVQAGIAMNPKRTNVAAPSALAPGKHTIVYEFIPDAAKPGTGGKSILGIDGQKVAEGKIPKTEPYAFSGDEGVDVGLDSETNVSPDYPQGNNAFTDKLVKVTVAQK